MSEWKEVRLGDIATMKYGKLSPKDNGGTIPIHSGYRIVGYTNSSNCPANTIIVVARGVGGCGDVKLLKEEVFLTNLSIAVSIDEIICLPEYFYYYHQIRNLRWLDSGSAQSQITIDDLKKYKFLVPDIETQRRIASILSTLDSKIECNRKICANLEAQAQALFKHWFIDFAPFKDGKFVESELGMIPEGWRVGTLFDVAEIHDKRRKPLSSMQRSSMEKLYPYYGATELMDYVDNYIFDGDYILMGEDGSVVKEDGTPLIQYVSGKFWVNNHAHVITGANGFSTEILIPFLKRYKIKGLVTGAVQAKLSQANMAKILIPIPPTSVLAEINHVICNMYSLVKEKTQENLRLSTLRDTLLPKLMSGQIKL